VWDWLLAIRIDKHPFLIGTIVVGSLAVLFLVLRRPTRRWILSILIAILCGGGAGVLAGWLTSDVFVTFGIPLTFVTKTWICLLGIGLALIAINLHHSRWWRKAIAIVCIPVTVIVAAAWVNIDFGAYRDLRDALGISPYAPVAARYLKANSGAMSARTLETWKPPAGQPTHGVLGTVVIPAVTSHFAARPASLYLPPAALVKDPPKLPVIVMMSGQPGSPSDMFTSGDTATILNTYAAAHRGIAPIVVAPDQLGAPNRNPMCADTVLGNSHAYLTVDVPNWIRHHLPVSNSSRQWAVAGFSEGGTCSMELGAGSPRLYRSILSISGELQPTIGSTTLKKAFGGSQAAYAAVKPLDLLKKNAPFSSTFAIFGVGADDHQYLAWQRTTRAAAARAGMTTQFIASPGTAHDWNTVRYVLRAKLPVLADHLVAVSGS
jgi:S-formylglutathione hydrolase FrmB